jgi:hypothetical protein
VSHLGTAKRVWEYRLQSPPSIICNVLRKSLSVDSQNIPYAILNGRGSWVISVRREGWIAGSTPVAKRFAPSTPRRGNNISRPWLPRANRGRGQRGGPAAHPPRGGGPPRPPANFKRGFKGRGRGWGRGWGRGSRRPFWSLHSCFVFSYSRRCQIFSAHLYCRIYHVTFFYLRFRNLTLPRFLIFKFLYI